MYGAMPPGAGVSVVGACAAAGCVTLAAIRRPAHKAANKNRELALGRRDLI
jgi:hypothetical protein